jgi:hypothetical protein
MADLGTSRTKTNVVANRELSVRAAETCHAPIETAWEVLADLSTHPIWGGARNKKRRPLAFETTATRASVGTEFSSTRLDRWRRMRDRSVVTEVARPWILEFVTQSEIESKRGRKLVGRTAVHRYEIESWANGCRVSHEIRTTGANGLLLRTLATKRAEVEARHGLRVLTRMTEERAGAR